MIQLNSGVEYVGKDLEAMSFAVNYHRWIIEQFRPFLGDKVVEVGAGTGSFSELIIEERPESLTVVEPSDMFDRLTANLSRFDSETSITYHQALFEAVQTEIATSQPDSILYVNVLEHIEDDRREILMVSETLGVGGRFFVFVPALQFLYGPFDKKIGHFRRYAKSEIENKCREAGFSIIKSTYFDFAGIVPWFLKYKLLRSDSLESSAVNLYDKFVVPVARVAEGLIPLPIGKNILVIAEKGPRIS